MARLATEGPGWAGGAAVLLTVPVFLTPAATEGFRLDGPHLEGQVSGPDVGWGLWGWEC